jgi:adhesin HecA-like repeat protein
MLIGVGLLGSCVVPLSGLQARGGAELIDDFSDPDLISALGSRWRGVSDIVMGGISNVSIDAETIDGRACLRLTGDVRLDNNGGFVQAALDLAPPEGTLDASDKKGLRLLVRGNGERYSVHLRTTDAVRPWQSYRAHFIAGPTWETVTLPFDAFEPYRLEAPLDVTSLRRIGLVAIGREFSADLAVARLEFYG